MFEFIAVSLPMRITDGVLSSIYCMELLKSKYSRRTTLLLWNFVYLIVNVMIYDVLGLDQYLFSIITSLVQFYLIQLIFFKWDYNRQLFVTLSFIAGKAMLLLYYGKDRWFYGNGDKQWRNITNNGFEDVFAGSDKERGNKNRI